MADNFDNYSMKVQARVDLPSNKDIDTQIRKLEKSISKLKVSGQFDDTALRNLTNQLNTLKASITTANFSPTALTELTNQVNRALQNINIGNINVGNVGNQVQQAGQQIGNAISQSVVNSTNGASQATDKILRDFSELNDAKRKFVDESELISKEDIADANKFYQTVREAFKEFGQVTISKGEMTDGELESLQVKIQQVNGELKTTREFMLYLNQSSTSPDKVKLADDDTIKTTERMVQHLNEAKNITNATGDEANALKQKLAEQEKYYDKLEQATKEQLSIEQKRITAGEKQLEILDKQSKRRDSRISYNKGQIDKKGLTDISRVRDINDMVSAGSEKYDSAFAKEIDKNISNLSKLKDKWQEQGVYVDEFKTKVETLENALNNIDSGDVKGLNSIKQQMETLSKEASQIADINKIQLSWSDGSYEAKYDSLIAKTRQWVDANDESVISTQKLTQAYNEFNTAESNFAKDGSSKNRDILIQKEEELGRQLKATTNDIKVQNAEWAKSSKVDSLHQKIQEFYDKNTATHRQWGGQLQNLLNETAHGAQVTASRINEIEQEYLGVVNAARQAGKLGQSFFGSIKEQASKFVQWFSVTSVVMEGVQAIKKMTQEVIAVDSAMVELRKVSDASNNDLKNYFDEAAKSAKDLGAAVSDVISATADWSRLGYSLDDSKKLAEVAILYKNVGDGIDVDTANESLVSTLRGFQLSAEDAMNIVDQFNEVANNFPIDSAGIGEALQRSAASFYEANTDLSKSIALITGTNSVIQDPDSVGTMWKTVSMRIRGATAELEEAGLETEGMVETTSQLQALVKGMTGFDIMKDEDTFKDIYEIVIGIGNEWQNLSDIEQASLLEALAGKRQGNALAAALNNISMIEDAYNTATNSAGSALEEQEEYEKGIQYSLDRLEAKFQEFSNHVLESELIKGIVDFGTTTLDVVDKVTSALGSLGTIGLGAGLFASFKGAGRVKIAYPHLYTYACRNKTLYA